MGASISSETTPTDARATASSRNSLRLAVGEFGIIQCPHRMAANLPSSSGTTRYAGTTPPFGLAYVMS
jgi:hypothetical protein